MEFDYWSILELKLFNYPSYNSVQKKQILRDKQHQHVSVKGDEVKELMHIWGTWKTSELLSLHTESVLILECQSLY